MDLAPIAPPNGALFGLRVERDGAAPIPLPGQAELEFSKRAPGVLPRPCDLDELLEDESALPLRTVLVPGVDLEVAHVR